MARSLREGIQYAAGFGLGAMLAIPVAVVLGPSIAGIAVIVLAGVVIGSWRRLGGQSTQVTFTALFVLLTAGRYSPGQSWPRHERRLSEAAEQARAAARNARESPRWNPRARVERAVPRPDGVVLDSLEELTARTRAVARVLLDAAAGDESLSLPASFGESYATMLRTLTGPVRQLADLRSAPPDRDDLAGASGCQDHLERQAAQLARSTGNENATRHLVRQHPVGS